MDMICKGSSSKKDMKKVMLVFGTRPEAIKMCPVIQELKSRASFKTVVCVTGQHREMLDQTLQAFKVKPDYDLSIMQQHQSLFDITSKSLNSIQDVLMTEKPDIVLVHGDTSTTFAAALACFYLQIPVGHVEAGLRTYDIYSPYPEEFNRQAVSLIAKYHFAPTKTAKENLLKEGKDPRTIFITGNTAIDALKTTVQKTYSHPALDWAGSRRLIVLTAHRRENLGEPQRQMFRAIKRIVEKYEDIAVLYPIHLNPSIRETAHEIFDDAVLSPIKLNPTTREAAYEIFDDTKRIKLIEPLGVLDFHNILARSHLILTDSGGIQEEAPSLGKPVLVMRDTTERPEGIDAGTLKLVGTKEETIYNAFEELLIDENLYLKMSSSSNPYGDGLASKRIVDILSGAYHSEVAGGKFSHV